MSAEHGLYFCLVQQIEQTFSWFWFYIPVNAAGLVSFADEEWIVTEYDRRFTGWLAQLLFEKRPHLFFALETTSEERRVYADHADSGTVMRKEGGAQDFLVSGNAFFRDGFFRFARSEFVSDIVIARNKEDRG